MLFEFTSELLECIRTKKKTFFFQHFLEYHNTSPPPPPAAATVIEALKVFFSNPNQNCLF